MITETTKSTQIFQQFMDSLTHKEFLRIRREIIRGCKITPAGYLNWYKGQDVPESQQYLINHITGKDVFPGKTF